MKLIIVHHHLRPGGVRRVIELAVPHLLAHWPEPIQSVVLATGEVPDSTWLRNFRARIPGVTLKVIVLPAFNYLTEQESSGAGLWHSLRDSVIKLIRDARSESLLFWAHNLGLGRNLYLARELTCVCHALNQPLIVHHHDWWFENRWHHFAAMCEPGFQRLPAVANAILASSVNISHIAINEADAKVLKKHFGDLAGWLPNPVEPELPPPNERVKAARSWLTQRVGENAPVWLMPCRLLRRKNIAEALLLARWLRPKAWLVTTGGVSSAAEQAYADTLTTEARNHGWQLRLGVLAGENSQSPTVSELLAASEAVLLTSLQEGFGLPYLEAPAANRPLLARKLPNIAPDLAKFGFTFPQSYTEIWVDPSLFDWADELGRQQQLFHEWKKQMPKTASRLVKKFEVLAAGKTPRPVPFSRLTLTAQLEILRHPVEFSWARCAALNASLPRWRDLSASGKLRVSPWPRSARRWLGGEAYARRFIAAVPTVDSIAPPRNAAKAAQTELLRQKLRVENFYPILWNSIT
jgi:hypothetical protein